MLRTINIHKEIEESRAFVQFSAEVDYTSATILSNLDANLEDWLNRHKVSIKQFLLPIAEEFEKGIIHLELEEKEYLPEENRFGYLLNKHCFVSLEDEELFKYLNNNCDICNNRYQIGQIAGIICMLYRLISHKQEKLTNVPMLIMLNRKIYFFVYSF